MTFAVQTDSKFRSTASSRRNAEPDDFLVSQRKSLSDHIPTIADLARAQSRPWSGSATTQTMIQPRVTSFDERIFDSLVSLKVAISQYAMHLGAAERQRLFEELDSKINVEDWHEDDTLPAVSSLQEFLKWMIYSKHCQWTSIGASSQGSILVAWHTPRVLLTANFEARDSVRWTAQVKSADGEVGHSVGKCTLRLFAEQAMFYLKEASGGKVKSDNQA